MKQYMYFLVFALIGVLTIPVLAADTPLPWVLSLQGNANNGKPLVLVIEATVAVDVETLTATAYSSLSQVNGLPVDVSKLKHTDGALKGNVTLTLPDVKAPIASSYTLDASVKDGVLTGTFTGKEGDKEVTGTLGWGKDQLPLGHQLFYPSPSRPIGYRGDGNGVFPGARVPLEFWEETKDKKAKNIIWQIETPTWGNTEPIVVGNRVFVKSEPNLLSCIDADSGKILWTKAANAWEIGGAYKKLADKLQQMHDIYSYVEPGWGGLIKNGTMTSNKPYEIFKALVDTYKEKTQPKMVAALKELDPGVDYDKAASSVLLGLEDIVALKKDGKIKDDHQVLRGDVGAIRSLIEKRIAGLWKIPNGPVDNKRRPIGIELGSPWGNLVGFAMAVPVSDGERVYATFGQGQVVAYDLDGNLLWGQLLRTSAGNNCNLAHIPSPLLADGVLIVNIDHTILVGLDAKSGKNLWKTDIQGPGGYSVGSHKIVRLTNEAASLTVLVTESCKVVRVSDGKIIGTIPIESRINGGPSIIGIGDVVFKGACGDAFDAPYTAFKLTLVDQDNVTAVKVKVVAKGSVYQGCVVNEQLQSFAPEHQGDSLIVVGDKFVDGLGGYMAGEKGGEFRIAQNNGGQLQYISTGNKLLYHKPKMPAMEKYASEIYEQLPAWNTNYAPCPAFFSNVDTLNFAQGGRLYIRSTSHLYCIGAGVNGTSKDDPALVTKIRALTQAADLLPYLDDASPQNRYVAAQVLAKVDAKSAEAKWKELAVTDTSEEIRAIAVQALDTIDPIGKPGTAVLQEQIAKGGSVITTSILQQLGPAYVEAVLLPNLGMDRNERACLTALKVASDLGVELCTEKVRNAIVERIRSDSAGNIVRSAARIVRSWPGDAKIAATIAKIPPWKINDQRESSWPLMIYVNENLPPAERSAFLLDTLKKTDFHRKEIIRWALDTKPAIPGLVDWIITAANAGNPDAMQYLAEVTDTKTAEGLLLPLLEQPKSTFAAAAALYDIKSSELIAATAIAKVLPTIAANNGVVQQAMSVMDKYIAHTDPAVRTALLPGFIAVLNNEKAFPSAKRMIAERLARLGVEAKPALDALKQAATSTNKEIADSATAAIKAIEDSEAKTGK